MFFKLALQIFNFLAELKSLGFRVLRSAFGVWHRVQTNITRPSDCRLPLLYSRGSVTFALRFDELIFVVHGRFHSQVTIYYRNNK